MTGRLEVAVMCLFLLAGGCSDAGSALDAGTGDAGTPDAGTDVTADLVVPETTGDASEDGRADADAGAPPPYVSARKVETPDDLVGGDNAYGIVGKSCILENDRIRVLVQDKGVSVHLGLHGGNIIDAGRMADGKSTQNDVFREMFPVVGFRVSSVDTVEILKDGSDGVEAVIRITGTDVETGLIDILDDFAWPIGVTIRTDYVLRPGEERILLRTEVENPSDKALTSIMTGDFLLFGGPMNMFTPEGGFGGTPTHVTALVAAGNAASYGYVYGPQGFDVPMMDANGTVSFLGMDMEVPAGGTAAFERWFVVGTGDVASVMDDVYDLHNRTTRRLGGRVLDEKGAGLSGALVTVFDDGKGTPEAGGLSLNQALTGPDGAFQMQVLPGKYDVVASAQGRSRVPAAGVDVQEDAEIDLSMAAAGAVELDIHELALSGAEVGRVPTKVSLYCGPGAEAPWGELQQWEQHGLCAVLYSLTGTETLPLRPGTYSGFVSRGIEYERLPITGLVVEAGKTAKLAGGLIHSVSTPGYFSADMHQHTMGSNDARPTFVEKTIENLVEHVEIPTTTEHDNITSYQPAVAQLGVEDLMHPFEGCEVSVNGIAHFNMFAPDWQAPDLYDYIGAKLPMGKTIAQVFEAVRAVPGVKVIQMNHPRSSGNGYLWYVKYDPVSGAALAEGMSPMPWDIDTMEVKDEIGAVEQYLEEFDATFQQMAKAGSRDIPALRDWFSFLNQGLPVTAMGNSDSHGYNGGVGYSRNYLRLDTDKIEEVTHDMVLAALLEQRNVVSNGPFIRVDLGGIPFMGSKEALLAWNGLFILHVTVSAPTWIAVDKLEIYANGRPVWLRSEPGTLDEKAPGAAGAVLSVPLPPAVEGDLDTVVRLDADVLFNALEQDTWFVFVVKGSGSLEPTGDGWPFAYTNPIYVDVDGNGFQAIDE